MSNPELSQREKQAISRATNKYETAKDIAIAKIQARNTLNNPGNSLKSLLNFSTFKTIENKLDDTKLRTSLSKLTPRDFGVGSFSSDAAKTDFINYTVTLAKNIVEVIENTTTDLNQLSTNIVSRYQILKTTGLYTLLDINNDGKIGPMDFSGDNVSLVSGMDASRMDDSGGLDVSKFKRKTIFGKIFDNGMRDSAYLRERARYDARGNIYATQIAKIMLDVSDAIGAAQLLTNLQNLGKKYSWIGKDQTIVGDNNTINTISLGVSFRDKFMNFASANADKLGAMLANPDGRAGDMFESLKAQPDLGTMAILMSNTQPALRAQMNSGAEMYLQRLRDTYQNNNDAKKVLELLNSRKKEVRDAFVLQAANMYYSRDNITETVNITDPVDGRLLGSATDTRKEDTIGGGLNWGRVYGRVALNMGLGARASANVPDTVVAQRTINTAATANISATVRTPHDRYVGLTGMLDSTRGARAILGLTKSIDRDTLDRSHQRGSTDLALNLSAGLDVASLIKNMKITPTSLLDVGISANQQSGVDKYINNLMLALSVISIDDSVLNPTTGTTRQSAIETKLKDFISPDKAKDVAAQYVPILDGLLTSMGDKKKTFDDMTAIQKYSVIYNGAIGGLVRHIQAMGHRADSGLRFAGVSLSTLLPIIQGGPLGILGAVGSTLRVNRTYLHTDTNTTMVETKLSPENLVSVLASKLGIDSNKITYNNDTKILKIETSEYSKLNASSFIIYNGGELKDIFTDKPTTAATTSSTRETTPPTTTERPTHKQLNLSKYSLSIGTDGKITIAPKEEVMTYDISSLNTHISAQINTYNAVPTNTDKKIPDDKKVSIISIADGKIKYKIGTGSEQEINQDKTKSYTLQILYTNNATDPTITLAEDTNRNDKKINLSLTLPRYTETVDENKAVDIVFRSIDYTSKVKNKLTNEAILAARSDRVNMTTINNFLNALHNNKAAAELSTKGNLVLGLFGVAASDYVFDNSKINDMRALAIDLQYRSYNTVGNTVTIDASGKIMFQKAGANTPTEVTGLPPQVIQLIQDIYNDNQPSTTTKLGAEARKNKINGLRRLTKNNSTHLEVYKSLLTISDVATMKISDSVRSRADRIKPAHVDKFITRYNTGANAVGTADMFDTLEAEIITSRNSALATVGSQTNFESAPQDGFSGFVYRYNAAYTRPEKDVYSPNLIKDSVVDIAPNSVLEKYVVTMLLTSDMNIDAINTSLGFSGSDAITSADMQYSLKKLFTTTSTPSDFKKLTLFKMSTNAAIQKNGKDVTVSVSELKHGLYFDCKGNDTFMGKISVNGTKTETRGGETNAATGDMEVDGELDVSTTVSAGVHNNMTTSTGTLTLGGAINNIQQGWNQSTGSTPTNYGGSTPANSKQ